MLEGKFNTFDLSRYLILYNGAREQFVTLIFFSRN